MSQNSSKMSEIYIPELMELDSYWQKAVEDAVCDTLKGERRLYYALRNRKKIKQKLEMLGMKTAKTSACFSAVISKNRLASPDDKETSESSSERSLSSKEDRGTKKTTSKSKGGAPSGEKRPKSPERPLLGNGSLEKMKKSQNSFNCEPMGLDNVHTEDSDIGEEVDMTDLPPEDCCAGDRSKNVKWIHVRKDSEFEISDTESVNPARDQDGAKEKKECKKITSGKEKNCDARKKFRLAAVSEAETTGTKSCRSDSQWETESEENIPGNPELERRLHLALAKREILNENLNAMSMGTNRIEVEIQGSAVQLAEKRLRAKALLSPFIRFYLEVYRELCHKCSVKEIAFEAGKRWWYMSSEQKADYSK